MSTYLVDPIRAPTSPVVPIQDASESARGAVNVNAQTFGGVKTFADPIDVSAGTTNPHYIDAAAYGVSPDASAADNNTNMAAALVAAEVSGKRAIQVPPGDYDFNIHGLGANIGAINITNPVRIFGAGPDLTVINGVGFVEGEYHGPVNGVGYVVDVPHDNGASLFEIDLSASGGTVIIEELTINGPAEEDLTMDTNSCWAIHNRGGGKVVVNNVNTSMWNQSIKNTPDAGGYPGTGTQFEANGGHWRYRSIGLLQLGFRKSGLDTQDSCKLNGVTFEFQDELTDLLFSLEGNQSNGHRHATYIYRGVDFETNQCKFLKTGGTGGTGWLHYEADDDPDNPNLCSFSRSTDDYFGPGVVVGMITNANVPTIVKSEFRVGSGHTGIAAQGNPQISGRMYGETGAQYAIREEGSSAKVSTANIAFEGEFAVGIFRTNNNSGPWLIGPNVDWRANCVSAPIRQDAGEIHIDGMLIDVESCGASMFLLGGKTIISNVHHSAQTPKGLFMEPTGRDLEVVFGPGNTYADYTNQPQISLADDYDLTLSGSIDFFEDAYGGVGFQVVGVTYINNLSGQMQFGRGVGGYSIDSDVLTVGLTRDLVPVDENGTPTINTINVRGGYLNGAVADDNNRYCTGRFSVLAVKDLAFGSSGNVIAAAGTRAVNSITTFQRVPSLNKWVEV